jgi:hypothetical protein
MEIRTANVVDNRDAHEMYGYLEARIETMKRRIADLERENHLLRTTIKGEYTEPSPLDKSA